MSVEPRKVFEAATPAGARIEQYEAEPLIDPVQARPDERALVAITTAYGYTLGFSVEDFDKLARAWVEREDTEKLRNISRQKLDEEHAAELRQVSTYGLREAWKATRRVLRLIEAEAARRSKDGS